MFLFFVVVWGFLVFWLVLVLVWLVSFWFWFWFGILLCDSYIGSVKLLPSPFPSLHVTQVGIN